MTLKEMALNNMDNNISLDLKAKYRQWIDEASQKNERGIHIRIDSEEYNMVCDWLKRQGLNLFVTGQSLDPEHSLLTVNIRWA